MKTFTKLALIATAGYIIQARLKRNVLLSNPALKHSVDRRLSVEKQEKK